MGRRDEGADSLIHDDKEGITKDTGRNRDDAGELNFCPEIKRRNIGNRRESILLALRGACHILVGFFQFHKTVRFVRRRFGPSPRVVLCPRKRLALRRFGILDAADGRVERVDKKNLFRSGIVERDLCFWTKKRDRLSRTGSFERSNYRIHWCDRPHDRCSSSF